MTTTAVQYRARRAALIHWISVGVLCVAIGVVGYFVILSVRARAAQPPKIVAPQRDASGVYGEIERVGVDATYGVVCYVRPVPHTGNLTCVAYIPRPRD